jgi:serine/threonine protein kinase
MEADSRRVGNYKLLTTLRRSRCGERWLASDDRTDSAHVLHWITLAPQREESKRAVARVDDLQRLRHPHVLAIDAAIPATLSSASGLWLVTPYTGHHAGLLTLDQLQAEKGGTMPIVEVERAMLHLLEASEYAHAQGVCHGSMEAREIQVDRRGSLVVELYGLARVLGAHHGSAPEFIRDEIRSIVALGYHLITGLSPDEPRLRVGKLIRQLNPAWDDWFDMGLDASGGFQSAQEALGQLPSARGVPESVAAPIMVKTMVGGVFKALRGMTRG